MTPRTLPAVTLWQPWAGAVFQLGKDVENRTWSTSYRGLLAVHAGQRWDASGAAWLAVASSQAYPRGVLLGTVHLVAVTRDARSRWAQPGAWHWVLADPRPFPEPIPWRGRQGLFPVTIP